MLYLLFYKEALCTAPATRKAAAAQRRPRAHYNPQLDNMFGFEGHRRFSMISARG